MENSWPRKCDSMWSAAAASVVSSSKEPQNQVFNGGFLFNSSVQERPTSSAHRMAPEALCPLTPSMNYYNSDHAGLGSSLLSLLSGAQCITPAEVRIASSNASGFATGNVVSLVPSGLLSRNLNNRNVEAGLDLSSVISSKARVSENHGSKSGPSNALRGAHMNIEKLDLPKAGMHQNLPSSENRPFPSRSVGYVNGSIPSNARKLFSHSSGALQKPDPPISCLSSTVTTDCPRVFCLNLSGDLLLSNTGLLGVVCSCHGFHMSIAKFSEHSGLSNVNPGSAVSLDSGETIAQWRKVYFYQFGIKSPEDHCGWDWPEGFSVTAGLVKHFPTVSSASKNYDLCNQDSSLASVQSSNLRNNTIYPNNFHSVQKVPNQFVHNEKQRNAQECLSSSLKNNLHSVAKNQKMIYVTSESSAMSNLAGLRGPDNGCQAASFYMLQGSKSGDPSVFHTHLPNMKTPGTDTGIGRFSGSLVQRDVVSSNVELRLGQPSQQRQSSGSLVQPTLGSHINGNHRQAPNNFFLEQHVPESYSKSVEDRRQHSYLASCISTSSRKTEQSQFDRMNQICGLSNDMPSSFQIEQFKGDAAGSSVVAHLKHPLDGRIHLKSINHVVNGSHVMESKGHSESPTLKTCQFGFPFFRGETSDRGFSSNLPGSQKHANHENGGSAIGSSPCAAELSFGSHAKAKGRTWSFSRGENDSDHKVCSAGKDENTIMCRFPGGMTDDPDRGNTFNYMGQALYPAQIGELVSDASRSFNSPRDFRRIPPTQAVQMGFPATNSHGFQSLTPLSKKENIGRGPKMMDENVSMSLIQHASELYNKNIPTTSFKAILEQDRLRNFCGKSQAHIGSSVSDKRINETNYDSLLKTSEVATQCFPSANFPSSDNATLPSVTDELSNFSVLSKGGYHHGKAEIRNQFVSDMQSTRQIFLRLGGTENISPSCEAGKCPQRCLPSKHNFAVRTKSLTGRYDQRGKTIVAECKDQEGNTGNGIATSLGPELGKNRTFAEIVNSSNHKENMEQNRKKAEFNSFLWRDVPKKAVGKCSLACAENFGDSSNKNIESKAAEAAGKCYNESVNDGGGSFKVQEMSNVSSGCSAPVVTQASVEANTKDSSTVDAEDARDAGNPVMDEGSGIERCWSSDDGVDSERNVEFSKLNLGDKRPSKPFLSKPKSSLIDELRFRDSLRLRELQQLSHTGNCIQENGSLMQKSERDTNIWKRRPAKRKKLTSSFSPPAVSVYHNDTLEHAGDAELQSHSVKDTKMLFPCGQGQFEGCPGAAGRIIKQRSIISLSTDISHDRDVCRIHHVEEDKPNIKMDLNDNCECSEAMGRKWLRLSGRASEQIHLHRSKSVDSEVAVKETSINCNVTSSQPVNISQRPRRPVVCEKYGVIANGNPLKPAKIVSLRMLLEAPSKCKYADANKQDSSSVKLLKKAAIKGNNGSLCKSSKMKEKVNGTVHHHNEMNLQHAMDEMKTTCCTGSKEYDNVSHVMKKRRCDGNKAQATPDSCQITEVMQKYNEVRKQNLHELTTKENHSSHVKFPITKNVKSVPQTKSRFLCKLGENAEADKISTNEICNAKISTVDDNFFCCVCGSSSKDENNDLLECSRCLIKVHQACYGIYRVPKANWYCRPCKTSSNNIACVLCGYGGGAMTRALRSHNIVKSLLQAWNTKAESNAENTSFSVCLENQFEMLSSSNSVREGNPFLVIRSAHADLPSQTPCDKELYKDSISMVPHGPAAPAPVEHKRDAISKTDKEEEQDQEVLICNSIIAGVLDSTVKQWVHMVCGLWTPGTRCPNVDTMSAFDVSGACTYEPYFVCSICERPGGSCIQCRVVGCNVQFHPWCAHQKGLLQSEVEGDDNESVGFYGRCLRHSRNQDIEPGSNHVEEKLTCARTEGYKGRKQDGVHYNLPPYSDGCGGSPFVPQEQLDAWIHINRQKPQGKRPRKLSASEIKHDYRKEYARYKQTRGWKHLVVYKSGIHGLGLYTSQFIPCGAMVVEYVGEIVGSRVADKRETEYHSGKKLQYKSACYFFRIDKEYIVDATRKGGIARFVNHSCKPNCVAEIISVRNEKKVVFFAERDIYPGEEITYDYHFNHEDEGKKIPCYCNSKNCRRYLN